MSSFTEAAHQLFAKVAPKKEHRLTAFAGARRTSKKVKQTGKDITRDLKKKVHLSKPKDLKSFPAKAKLYEESSSDNEEPWFAEADATADCGLDAERKAKSKGIEEDAAQVGATNTHIGPDDSERSATQLKDVECDFVLSPPKNWISNGDITEDAENTGCEGAQSAADASKCEDLEDAPGSQKVADNAGDSSRRGEAQSAMSTYASSPDISGSKATEGDATGQIQDQSPDSTMITDQESTCTPAGQVFETPQKSADDTFATEVEPKPETWEGNDGLYESSLASAKDCDVEALETESPSSHNVAEKSSHEKAGGDREMSMGPSKSWTILQQNLSSHRGNSTPLSKGEELDEIVSPARSTTPPPPVPSKILGFFVGPDDQPWQSQPSLVLRSYGTKSQAHDKSASQTFLGEELKTILLPPGLSSDPIIRQLNVEALAKVETSSEEDESNVSVSEIIALPEPIIKNKTIQQENPHQPHTTRGLVRSTAIEVNDTLRQSQSTGNHQGSLSEHEFVDDNQPQKRAWQDTYEFHDRYDWLNDGERWEDDGRLDDGPSNLAYDDIPDYGPVINPTKYDDGFGDVGAQEDYPWQGDDERWEDHDRLDAGPKDLGYDDIPDYGPTVEQPQLVSLSVAEATETPEDKVSKLKDLDEASAPISGDLLTGSQQASLKTRGRTAKAELGEKDLFDGEKWLADVDRVLSKDTSEKEHEQEIFRIRRS